MLKYQGNGSDKLQKLIAENLGGKIGSRLRDLVYENYMKLDLENDFLEYFRYRPFSHESTRKYIGAGKVVSAGSLLAWYFGKEDSKILLRSKKFVRELIRTMDEDGYIGTFCRQKDGMQLSENWVLHDMEYLILGFCDHYACTGDPDVLAAAEKAAGFILRTFPRVPHPEEICCAGFPEAFFALYTITGKEEYLRFGADTRAGYQRSEILCETVRKWRQTVHTPYSHVYVMTARAYAQLLLYRAEGRKDSGLLEMTDYLRKELLDAENGGLLVTGSSSQKEHFSYDQEGTGAVEETCVTAYLIRHLESQMTLTGDLRFGDVIERSIYNALHAVMSPDGRSLRYFTPFEGKRTYFDRDTYCCPGNFRRIMAELVSMCCYKTEHGAAVNLYAPSDCAINSSVILHQETDYPHSGMVKFSFRASEPFELELSLRIPRFCRGNFQIKLNGTVLENPAPEAGCVRILRKWDPSDVLELELPLPGRWVAGRAGQSGKAAYLRGPLLFCIGTEKNEKALERHPDFTHWTVDPEPAGKPCFTELNGRSGSMAIPFTAHADGEDFIILLTEFTDATGVHTYFRLTDPGAAGKDEILEDCFRLS